MSNLFRSIPKIDKILNLDIFQNYNRDILLKVARENIEILREDIRESRVISIDFDKIVLDIKAKYLEILSPTLKKMINATGIVVHTNLGRSVISKEILESISDVLSSYNNLEYNEKEGSRGERYDHISKLACELFGCEDVLLVNNNASAVFLILNTFAKSKEVILSRGELVEIGGSFRIPSVMADSGAILKEIGTTNRTHLRDYEEVINEQSSMIAKIHKSNYDIVGFTKEVDLEEISKLAKERDLISYYDLGSGFLGDLPLPESDSIKTVLQSGIDLVSFSGDKILGSCQVGIICGSKKLIDRLKNNQLLRMLRVDKITIALLQKTLESYITNPDDIVTLKLIKEPIEIIKNRAEKLKSLIDLESKVKRVDGYIGGGAMPNRKIDSFAVVLDSKNVKKLEIHLRENSIISRLEFDSLILDCRTLFDRDLDYIAKAVNSYKESN